MPEIREITIQWAVQNSPGGTSVLHFATGTDPDTQLTQLESFFEGIKSYFPSTTTASVANEGREFDDATGTLTGIWSSTVTAGMTGTAPGPALPNPVQGLLRFNTALVVNGRVVKGRMYIPGLSQDLNTLGEVNEAARIAIQADWLSEVVTAGTQLIWARPVPESDDPDAPAPRAGSSSAVIETSMWREFAVLRRRR